VLGHPDLLAAAVNRRTVQLRDGRHAQMVYAPLPPDRRRRPGHESAQAVVIVGGLRERVDPADIIALVAPVESQCQGHRAYTKQEAKRARDRAQAKLGERMAVYRCPHCPYWHVGRLRPDPQPA
jgi:hypothetical protein